MNESEPVYIQNANGDWVFLGYAEEPPNFTPLPEEEEDVEAPDYAAYENFRQRYVLGFDPANEDGVAVAEYNPGGLGSYCQADVEFTASWYSHLAESGEAAVADFGLLRDSIDSFMNSLGELRTTAPELFQDIETYPMSSDAMRVNYTDDMENSPW